jgi:hypothetical protein
MNCRLDLVDKRRARQADGRISGVERARGASEPQDCGTCQATRFVRSLRRKLNGRGRIEATLHESSERNSRSGGEGKGEAIWAQIGMLITLRRTSSSQRLLWRIRVTADCDRGLRADLVRLVLSRYFAGFTLGALRCERIIERVGRIRAYAAFVGGRRRDRRHAAPAQTAALVDPARARRFWLCVSLHRITALSQSSGSGLTYLQIVASTAKAKVAR